MDLRDLAFFFSFLFPPCVFFAQELNQLLVVQFTAGWCMPCKAIANSMNQLSRREKDVVFLKVDIDRASAIATQLLVTSVRRRE